MSVFYAEIVDGYLTGRSSKDRNRFPNFVPYGTDQQAEFHFDCAMDKHCREHVSGGYDYNCKFCTEGK